MRLDRLEAIELGGATQWIRVRSEDVSKPTLLLMQQGPGLPMINEVRNYERLLGLERHFTVVYWDQRGTGLSALPLRKLPNRFEISSQRMIDDTASLLDLLYHRFGRKTFIAGFSFGATFAVRAAVEHPELIAAIVAAGMDVNVPAAERHMQDFLLTAAHERNSRRAVRQLARMDPPPVLKVRQFTTRARWMANFGGVTINQNFNDLTRVLLTSLVRSADYSAADVIRAVRGISAAQAALLPELATTDLAQSAAHLEVPIVLAQGRHDQLAPGEFAQRYYDSLTSPSKRLVWFENSAHTPQYDEPDKFRNLLLDVSNNRFTEEQP
ncbi:alpha/beta hydrolase [Kribbella sp. NPDC000426]|uniref:alpha/beta fold hydrolase n=1 Tax=Kribbella sp. NPDC000426 TaxID=3154255 RepID=UPI003318D45D